MMYVVYVCINVVIQSNSAVSWCFFWVLCIADVCLIVYLLVEICVIVCLLFLSFVCLIFKFVIWVLDLLCFILDSILAWFKVLYV